MSFKSIESQIHQLQLNVDQLLLQYTNYMNTQYTDVNTVDTDVTDPNTYLHAIQPLYNTINQLHQQIELITPLLHKYVLKAQVIDVEQQIYGTNQIKTILHCNQLFHDVQLVFEPIYADLNNQYLLISTVCTEYNDRLAVIKQQQETERQRVEHEHAQQQAEQQRIQKQKDDESAAEQARVDAIERDRQAEIQAERDSIQRQLQRQRDIKLKHECELEQQRIQRENELAAHRAAALESQQRQQQHAAVQSQLQHKRQQIQLIDSGVKSFSDTIELFIQHNNDHNNNKSSKLLACHTLLKYINTILNNPLDASCRTINTNDTILHDNILSHEYGDQCIQSLGFQLNDEHTQYVLTVSAEQWNTLQECKRVITKQLVSLKSK